MHVSRSKVHDDHSLLSRRAPKAKLAKHLIHKEEVIGSFPIGGSFILRPLTKDREMPRLGTKYILEKVHT
jgi:hypothetical protein